MKNWKSRESSKRVPDARDLSRRRRNFLRRAVKSSTEDFLITVATSEILPPSFFEYRIAMIGEKYACRDLHFILRFVNFSMLKCFKAHSVLMHQFAALFTK